MDILSDVNIVGDVNIVRMLRARFMTSTNGLDIGDSDHVYVQPKEDSSKPLSSTNFNYKYQQGDIGMVVRKTIDIPIGCSVFELFNKNDDSVPMIQIHQMVGKNSNAFYNFKKIEVDVYSGFNDNGNGTEFYLGEIVPRTSEIKIMALAHY